jgi:hypothetical protein
VIPVIVGPYVVGGDTCCAAEERVYSLPMCDNDSFDDMVA